MATKKTTDTPAKPAAKKPAAGKALTIGRGSKVPVDAKALQAQLLARKQQVLDKLGRPSTPTISVRNDKSFELPDGSVVQAPEFIRAVVIDFASVNALYEGAYDPKNPEPPICFAAGMGSPDSLIASDKSPQKQADDCATCPLNQWGSGVGDGKACKNTRKLAVVLMDDLENEDREGDIQFYPLNVSPTGIKHWDGYVRNLATRNDLLPVQVVTKIGFDAQSTWASLRFAPDEVLSETHLAEVLGLQEAVEEMLTAEPDWAGFEAQRAERQATRKPAGGRRPAGKPAAGRARR